MFYVIENTPGYMPDADEPNEYEDFADALQEAWDLGKELVEHGYKCISFVSYPQFFQAYYETEDKMYDLGRTITVGTDD